MCMTTITILPESISKDGIVYRAIAGAKHSEGRTVGEALDELTKQLSSDDAGTLVIVQNLRPDDFFTAQQQRRLSELMESWRAARDNNSALPSNEQAELEGLIEAELQAATKRAGYALSELGQ
jgi:hypothetical protein